MNKKIIILGLNPAWQRTLILKSLSVGDVNRCEEILEYASGKGINVAFAVKKWKSVPLVLQFFGGASGRALCRDLNESEIHHDSVEIKSATRICQTLVASSKCTELIDPSPGISSREALLLCDKVKSLKDSADFWVFSGTFPSGFSEKYLRKMLKNTPSSKIVLDGIIGVTPILKHGIHVLKINRQELFQLTGRKSVNQAWSELRKIYSIDHLIITDGANPVTCCSHHKTVTYKVPECENIINPIGAGDAFTGTLAAMLQKGMSLEKIMPLAIGAGVSKCENRRSVDLSIQRAKYYAKKSFEINEERLMPDEK